MVVSYEGCSDEEIFMDKDPKEEEYALGGVTELIKSLTTKLERLESEDNIEDFPVLEADVLGVSSKDDNEYFIEVEALVSSPNEIVILGLT
jgi:hypothetical protein